MYRSFPIKENYNKHLFRVEAIFDWPTEHIPINQWRRIEHWCSSTKRPPAAVLNQVSKWGTGVNWTASNEIKIDYGLSEKDEGNISNYSTTSFDEVLNFCAGKFPSFKVPNSEDKPVKVLFEGDNGDIVTSFTTNPTISSSAETCSISGIVDSLTDNEIQKIKDRIDNLAESITNKEEKSMNKMFDNIFNDVKLGKDSTNLIAYSIKGIAFRGRDDRYFIYDSTDTATEVTGMTFDMPKFLVPVAINAIKSGDIIIHDNIPVIVREKTNDGIKVVYPLTREIKIILPAINLFGFNYVTKVINPFENMAMTASTDNPFGNLLPLMMLSDGITKGNDGDMMKFFIMSQMTGDKIDFTSNPMLLYMMMMDNKDNGNDFFQIMMMTQLLNPSQISPINQNTYTEVPVSGGWSIIPDGIQIGDYPPNPEVTC